MAKTIDEIRAALQAMHAYACGNSDHPYMSIPARPDHDADLVLDAAIDELETLRYEVGRARELRQQAEGQAASFLARALRAEAGIRRPITDIGDWHLERHGAGPYGATTPPLTQMTLPGFDANGTPTEQP